MSIFVPTLAVIPQYGGLVQALQQPITRDILAKTVGKQLKELFIHNRPCRNAWPVEIPSLHDKGLWPELKLVQYDNIWDPTPCHHSDPDSSSDSESESYSESEYDSLYGVDAIHARMNLLRSVYRQNVLHGEYQVKFTRPFVMRFPQLMDFPCENDLHIREARAFISWLRGVNGPDADDLHWMTNFGNGPSAAGFEAGTRELMLRLALFYEGPIKFRLSGEYAPIFPSLDTDRLKNILASRTQRLSFSPNGFTRTDGDGQEPHQEEIDWTSFLMEFLPKCKNMTEFRLVWEGITVHGNFPLRIFAQQLAGLCRDFQLRALDVDASTLMGPPNRPYVFDDEQLCIVNKHLSWINVPEQLPGCKDSDELMLLNLRELTLRNLYINSKAEFEWFMSLTTLKKLEKLRIDGLTWHRGYHRWAHWYGQMRLIPDEGYEGSATDYCSSDSAMEYITWDDQLLEGDDDQSDCSSTSDFGLDLRFSNRTDEALRIERLRRWIMEQLLAEARRIGGACRDVVIRGLVADAKSPALPNM
ncbi:hypothetical protein BZA77DRAFT_353736 [Pyronema omphalodes]|nr:hypothetical protein BZA77DRAFT_353736 [Pyronema omphalodes]